MIPFNSIIDLLDLHGKLFTFAFIWLLDSSVGLSLLVIESPTINALSCDEFWDCLAGVSSILGWIGCTFVGKMLF